MSKSVASDSTDSTSGIIMTDNFKHRLLCLEYASLVAGLATVFSVIWSFEKHLTLIEVLFFSSILCTVVLLYGLEYRVFSQLKEFNFRNGAGPGLWTCCLLPMLFVVQIYNAERLIPPPTPRFLDPNFFWRARGMPQTGSNDRTTLQWMWILSTLSTFGSSLFVISALCGTSEPKKLFSSHTNRMLCLILMGVGSALIYFIVEIEGKSAVFISAGSQLIFFYLTWRLPHYFPLSFSFGEVLLISQAVAALVTVSICHICHNFGTHYLPNPNDQISLFIEISLIGSIAALITLATLCYQFGPKLSFVVLSFGLAAIIIVLPLLRLVLRINPFVWCFNFLLESNTRLALFGLWCLLLMMSLIYVYSQSLLPSQPTTIMRKYFHLLILGVFFPGLIFDPMFLRFTSALLLGIFVIIEFIRYLEIQPLSADINKNFQIFLDEKDQGPLILSHIYLLVGCSIPVWLRAKGIPSFTGILSVGIGDAFASVGGKLFGRHQWPETNKTVEGTVLSICAQLLTVCILQETGTFQPKSTLTLTGIILSTSLLEAFTTQVDNLVVPLVFFILVLPVISISDQTIIT